MSLQRRGLGVKGEDLAAGYLRNKGFAILERNFSCRLGEIDIIARQGNCLVFVEVRTRSGKECGLAQESITQTKINRLRKLACFYLAGRGQAESEARFDVIAVHCAGVAGPMEITHIENAF